MIAQIIDKKNFKKSSAGSHESLELSSSIVGLENNQHFRNMNTSVMHQHAKSKDSLSSTP